MKFVHSIYIWFILTEYHNISYHNRDYSKAKLGLSFFSLFIEIYPSLLKKYFF